MITAYIRAAMELAEFELMENGRYFATVPPCKGFWVDGATIDECKAVMPEAFESWLLVGLRYGHQLPALAGIDLNPKPVHAEAY